MNDFLEKQMGNEDEIAQTEVTPEPSGETSEPSGEAPPELLGDQRFKGSEDLYMFYGFIPQYFLFSKLFEGYKNKYGRYIINQFIINAMHDIRLKKS